MRKLIVTNIVSLDGYFEGPGRDVMALPMDEFFDAHNLERQREADTLLLGAATYRLLKSFWPAVAEDPSAASAVALDPSHAEVLREIGQRNNTMRKVVVSNLLSKEDTAPWTDTTTIVPRADARAAVAELKRQEGRDVLMFGSRTLWNDLLAAGLVDELHLMVGATVLSGGTPAFGDTPVPRLRLLEVRRRPVSENVVLRYATA